MIKVISVQNLVKAYNVSMKHELYVCTVFLVMSGWLHIRRCIYITVHDHLKCTGSYCIYVLVQVAKIQYYSTVCVIRTQHPHTTVKS